MTEKVLKLLIEAEDFLSGEDMSRILGVTRTAIWKHIKKLKDDGYAIESVTNKGYRVSLLPDQLDAHELMQLLKGNDLVKQVFVYKTIDSTNKEAKRKAMEEGVSTALFLSEEQTLGIGRRGKHWVSKSGTGIFMSLLLRPNIKPANASMLTLLVGIAASKAIEKETGLRTQIKWPNDLVLNNKKICGILTEMNSEIDYINYVVIGVGINVNQTKIDEELMDIATSLSLEGGKDYSRKSLITSFFEVFDKLYNQFLLRESLDFVIEEYNDLCVNVGRMVKAEINGQTIIGESIRVDNAGSLIIRTKEGVELLVNSGEVSVRGLYGYVD